MSFVPGHSRNSITLVKYEGGMGTLAARVLVRFALGVLAMLVSTQRASAQASDPGAVTLLRAAIVAFADSNHLPMRDIVLDTVNSGRALMRGPILSRPRVVSSSAMREMAQSLGVQLAGDLEHFGLPGGLATCSSCKAHAPVASIMVFGPMLDGDSAVVLTRWVRLGADRDVSGLQRFRFTRKGSDWTLQQTLVESAEERVHARY